MYHESVVRLRSMLAGYAFLDVTSAFRWRNSVRHGMPRNLSNRTRTNLSDEAVQVFVGWTFDTQVLLADVVNSFIVDHESTVRVLQSGMRSQN